MGWLWAVMTAGIGAAEAYRINIGWRELDNGKAESALKLDYYPGDLGFDPLGLKPEDPAEFKLMQEKELAHCRLAMIAAAGFLAQEAVTKSTWGTYWGAPTFEQTVPGMCPVHAPCTAQMPVRDE